MPASKPSLVVFDLGKVVIEAYHTWRGALTSGGFPFEEDVSLDDPVFTLPEYLPYEAGTVAEEAYLAALGVRAKLEDPTHARRLHQAILGTEFPGMLELIREIKANGTRTAALSNNNPIHWERMMDPEHYPAIAEIEIKVPSFELGFHKPQPEIYSAFERRVGMSGDAILFIEDSQPNAEAAAASAGWQTFVVDTEHERAPQIRAELRRTGVLL